MIGIYKITCNINNMIYIGSSKNIKIRWKRHKSDLIKNKHSNIIFQRLFNKYGMDNLIFEIIEYCDIKDLIIKEQYYLDTLKPEINIAKNAKGGDNLTLNPNRLIIIEKIKNSVNETIKNMSETERLLKWSKPGNLNPNYNNKWSKNKKDKLSKLLKDKYEKGLIKVHNLGKTNIENYGIEKAKLISNKISKHAKSRIGDKNPFYNKTHTEETKKKISELRIGITPANAIKISIDNIIYDSFKDASKILSIPSTTIRWRCLSNNKKFNNYQLIG